VTDGIARGIVKPLKSNVFDADDIESAFRFLASGKHMGKVLLRIRGEASNAATLPINVIHRVFCNPNFSYIMPGGLGGFGLELADWLVLRGCRKLVMSSSQGISKQYQSYRIKIWESYGVQVRVNTSDISTKVGCEKLIRESIKLGPVGGIFNLAVILKDSIVDNQDAEKFVTSMGPKALATKHLDELSRLLCPDLQYFVVFSSVSCGRGNAGQSNYGMSNSVMERIMEQRHSLGLPAKAIQWGAVGEVGLVADMQEDKLDMEIGGTLQQRISSCLEELDGLMTANAPLVSSMVVAEKSYSSSGKGNILETIMNVMSIRDIKSVSMETTLSELGMDSLMTVEIQQTLEREYDLVIATQDLRSMTLSKLIKCSNNKDSASQMKVRLSNQAVPTGMSMLIRNLGDEANSQKTILELQTLSQSGVKTLIVPGLEGMAGQAWYNLAQSLKCQTFILQMGNTWESTDLDSIFEGVFPDISELFKDEVNFNIIGYSFGSILTLKIASALELMGKTGKVIFIDGSPKFIKTIAKEHITDSSDEAIQTSVLINAIMTIFPDDNGDKVKRVLSEKSWETRQATLIDISRNATVYSKDYILKIVNAVANRLKLTISLHLEELDH
jgi:fatty acid synthase, animal type